MVFRGFSFLLVGALVACLLPASARAAEPAMPLAPVTAKPVAIVFDTNENPPFIYGVGSAIDPHKPGFIIELLHAAADHAGIAISLNRAPWARGLDMLQQADADGIFMSSYTQERLHYGVYPMKDGQPDATRKLTDLSYWLFVRKDSGVTWDGKTISGLHMPVGAVTSYAVVPMLKSLGIPVEEDPIPLRILHKLQAGEIDAYAEFEPHVDELLHAYPKVFPSIVKLEPAIRTTPYYLMFSKSFYAERPDDAEHLWDAIAWVNAQPEFRAMVREKYAD
jgi:polar amino acid transport system substrate-binding protein